jgi:GNAT superfamily N-acetyltransferase
MSIRSARFDDVLALHQVEKAAWKMLRDFGIAPVPDKEPSTSGLDVPGVFEEGTWTWVVTDDADWAVGFVIVRPIDGDAYVEQLCVDPTHAHRRFGSALLDTATDWAELKGLSSLILSTFAKVPWNAPYYERLGFVVLSEADVTEGIRRVRAQERLWPAEWERVVMRRPVEPL